MNYYLRSNTVLTDEDRRKVLKKVKTLEKYSLPPSTSVEITISKIQETSTHQWRDLVQIYMSLPNYELMAEDSTNNLFKSTNAVVSKIEGQIRKYKTRFEKRKHDKGLSEQFEEQDMSEAY